MNGGRFDEQNFDMSEKVELYHPVTVYVEHKHKVEKVCDLETVQGWWNFTQALPVARGQTGPTWNAMSFGSIFIMKKGVEPEMGSAECAFKVETNFAGELETLILQYLGGVLQESCDNLSDHVMGLSIFKSQARETVALILDEKVDMMDKKMAGLKELLGEGATCKPAMPRATLKPGKGSK